MTRPPDTVHTHHRIPEENSMVPAWAVTRRYLSLTGVLPLPLQTRPLSLFASNRDKDVALAAVDAAYKMRAIACSREVSGSLVLNLRFVTLV